MDHKAVGTFQVKLAPLETTEPKIGRMSIDKVFEGSLSATSKGEMLSLMTEVKGSAAYVAIERVTGTLSGRRGSFALQHNASMERGKPMQTVTVVPDSGTDELAGLTGAMTIRIEGGKHFYEFVYDVKG
jgi:hypothetical protein